MCSLLFSFVTRNMYNIFTRHCMILVQNAYVRNAFVTKKAFCLSIHVIIYILFSTCALEVS